MLLYGVAEYVSKLYSNSHKMIFFFSAILIYMTTTILWLETLKIYNSLGILSTIWTIGATLLALFIGAFFFHETISMKQYIGITLALISIYFLI